MIDWAEIRLFNALGRTRRRMVYGRLAKRPMTVAELAKGVSVSRPAVSQYLKSLKDARLVEVSVVDGRRLYHADPAGLRLLRGWLERAEAVAKVKPGSGGG